MSILDRVVIALAPERGLRRVKAKAAAAAVMNYDAASRGARTYGWKAPATDADAAAAGGRARMRNLSRDMIRNRPWAARAQSITTANVVGTGVNPSVKDENGGPNNEAMQVIRDHLLTSAIDAQGFLNVIGMQTQVMDTVFSDGEIIARRRMRDPRFNSGLRLPFQVQLMEADHLDTVKTSHGQNEVIEGIEYGPTGRPEAYHLFPQHPGNMARITSGRFTSERVPAASILHIRRSDRPGQMRGTPWLAPVMMSLGELSDYQEAQILKQRTAALLAFFIEAGEDDKPYNGAALSEMQPGAIVGLSPGQKVVASDPPKVDGYDQFMRQGLMAVASGLGLTVESLTGDLRGVNFSGGRMGRMEMDRLVQVWQRLIIIDQFCRGVGGWTLGVWRLQGLNTSLPPAPDEIMWTAQRRALIDPAKEIKASIDEIEAGLTSRQRKIREFGGDPDDVARERAEDERRDGAQSTTEGD